jgi:hypothetical protein
VRSKTPLWIALVVLAATSTVSAEIRSPSRIDSSTSPSGTRIWVTNPAGAVLSRYDVPIADGTSVWVNHGAGTAAARPEGVASTSYASGGSQYEKVVYVGTDGNLNIGTIVAGGPISWQSVPLRVGRR